MSKKVILVGDTTVGKTSILFRYVYDKFDENMSSTFGAGFKYKEVKVNDNEIVKLNIWDTAGQEKYDALTKMYY